MKRLSMMSATNSTSRMYNKLAHQPSKSMLRYCMHQEALATCTLPWLAVTRVLEIQQKHDAQENRWQPVQQIHLPAAANLVTMMHARDYGAGARSAPEGRCERLTCM